MTSKHIKGTMTAIYLVPTCPAHLVQWPRWGQDFEDSPSVFACKTREHSRSSTNPRDCGSTGADLWEITMHLRYIHIPHIMVSCQSDCFIEIFQDEISICHSFCAGQPVVDLEAYMASLERKQQSVEGMIKKLAPVNDEMAKKPFGSIKTWVYIDWSFIPALKWYIFCHTHGLSIRSSYI